VTDVGTAAYVADPAPEATEAAEAIERLEDNIELVIQGKRDVVRMAIVCLLAEGHLLIEDVPGLGKTSLARSLCRSVDGKLGRIQFTPDLLPSDVVGSVVYNQADNDFEFHRGAVFANLVIADEINRATPKTQSALLEVMEELRVTSEGKPYDVPRPFMVVATQNPIDHDGTYPLPEAQLDRFLMRIKVGYPDEAAEVRVLQGEQRRVSPDSLSPVLTLPELERLIAYAHGIHVDTQLHSYAVRLAAATRDHDDVRLGASPRGSLALVRAGRAFAAAEGRPFVTPDDVKRVAPSVLAHRVLLKQEAVIRRRGQLDIVTELLDRVPVPTVNAAGLGR